MHVKVMMMVLNDDDGDDDDDDVQMTYTIFVYASLSFVLLCCLILNSCQIPSSSSSLDCTTSQT